jgi:hypothetical protein
MSLTKVSYSMISGAVLNVLDFGADPTGVTDSYAAFRAAIDSVGQWPGESATVRDGRFTLEVPRGKYLLSQELRLDRTMSLIGTGGGSLARLGTQLTFPAGSNGLVTVRHSGGTGGDGTGTVGNPDHYALGVVIENIGITALGKNATRTAGIAATTTTIIKNCLVNAFSGYGIYFQSLINPAYSDPPNTWADPAGSELISGIPPSTLGGAGDAGGCNGWYVENCLLVSNTLTGLHIVGGDSNNGVSTMVVAQDSLVGLSDQSGIGNTHIGFLPEICTAAAYRTGSDAGVTNLIGCNFTEGNGTQNCASDGTILLSCIGGTTYLAGQQPPKIFRAASNFVTFPPLYRQFLVADNPGAAVGMQVVLGEGAANMSVIKMQTELTPNVVNTNTETALHWDSTIGAWTFWNVNSIPILDLKTYDSISATGYLGAPNGLMVSRKAKVTAATAAPTTGTNAQGDQIINTLVAAGGSPGWVCVTSGTFSAATEAGTTTNGSATITGLADTSDFFIGEFVNASAGFASLTALTIVSIVTNTSITVDRVANASGACTLSTSDPVFKTMANVAA